MQLGTIEGKVNTSSFKFRATEEVKKFDFVSVKSNDKWILAQVEEVEKKPGGETLAKASIIGYRDKGLTKAPRRVIEPDSIVYAADQELISDTLGLEEAGLRIGHLETNPDIDIHVNKEDFYKHFAVLAQTGAGKSYLTGVLIEEMLEQDLPVMIIDPHGEFNSLSQPNPDNEDESERKGYKVDEYSPNTDINEHAMPLSFSSVNMEKKELLDVIPDSLTNSQMGVLYNALKRLRDKDEDYTLNDIMDEVSNEDSTAKWNLLNSLEQLERSGLFSEDAIDLEDLLEPGEATIINLKAVEPESAEMTMFMLAKRMFQLRKENRVPPFIMVIEEAHNFAPEKGFEQALSNKILRKIASEGRKFGLGIGVISQRPARIDKNVLSQANTQFILRVTNPNDLKAISKSFEGITSEVESMIKSLPPGVTFALGNEYPVMTDVRTRKSKHGGTTQTSEGYKEKQKIRLFRPQREVKEIETEKGEKHDVTYYPLYLHETDEKKTLYDAVSGEKKAEVSKVSGKEKKVLDHIEQDRNKSEIMEELDITLSKVTSIVGSLRKKGRVKDEKLETEESIFEKSLAEERVEEEKLIDREKSPEELGIEGAELVYYPYYSSGEDVYDPVLGREV
ncbi:MAG: DNA helicase HerA-like ATPase/DNA-binding MarR family transcriptional regulator [Candidatus Nanohaloarchaea archaeon]|jgi:DNA helicase HerA-like ATPase/DNA-binding MarR family transcriptional regulator